MQGRANRAIPSTTKLEVGCRVNAPPRASRFRAKGPARIRVLAGLFSDAIGQVRKDCCSLLVECEKSRHESQVEKRCVDSAKFVRSRSEAGVALHAFQR